MDATEKRLREEAHELHNAMLKITSAATAEGRDLTESETRDHAALRGRLRAKQDALREHMFNQPANGAGRAVDGSDMILKPGSAGHGEKPGVTYWRCLAGGEKGERIPVLTNQASLAQNVEQDFDGSAEDYIREIFHRVTGSGNTRYKAQMSTTGDSGLVPSVVSAQIIDEARALSRIFQAGALTVPMTTKELTIARITQSATPEWKAENEPFTSSNITTEPVTFTAKTLIAGVKSSLELAEDAHNLAGVVRGNLAAQLGLELDRAGIFGAGQNNQPRGIFNTTGVQQVDLGENGAAVTSYAPFSSAYEMILAANGEPNAAIYSPRTWGTLDRLTAEDNQPLVAPASFQKLLQLPTSQVPNNLAHGTAENASAAIVGAFGGLMVGIRTNLVLEATRVGADSDQSAWDRLQIWWRAYLRCDVQLMHPPHFVKIVGIIPASA